MQAPGLRKEAGLFSFSRRQQTDCVAPACMLQSPSPNNLQTSRGHTIMSHLSRRDFLGQSATAAGVVAASGLFAAAAEAPRKLKSAADQVLLGRTGIKTSLLGMGSGSAGVKYSSNQVKLGQAAS